MLALEVADSFSEVFPEVFLEIFCQGPLPMSEFSHRFVNTNGLRMHVAEAGEGYPVVMCHGFPELWYSWRHQMRALASAGLRAIAPDERGYGDTGGPEAIQAYTPREIVAAPVRMLHAVGIDKTVVVGPYWG